MIDEVNHEGKAVKGLLVLLTAGVVDALNVYLHKKLGDIASWT